MGRTRRTILFSIAASALLPAQQGPPPPPPLEPLPDSSEEDRLPNGKSRRDAIAKEQHEQALKDANDLLTAAQQLKDELQKAGDYVVPLASVKKTEEIEKLARRIRGRLKQ
jgi:hypothetical protein